MRRKRKPGLGWSPDDHFTHAQRLAKGAAGDANHAWETARRGGERACENATELLFRAHRRAGAARLQHQSGRTDEPDGEDAARAHGPAAVEAFGAIQSAEDAISTAHEQAQLCWRRRGEAPPPLAPPITVGPVPALSPEARAFAERMERRDEMPEAPRGDPGARFARLMVDEDAPRRPEPSGGERFAKVQIDGLRGLFGARTPRRRRR